MAVYLGSQFVDATRGIEVNPLTRLIEGTIVNYENSSIELIQPRAFAYCQSLKMIDLPNAKDMYHHVFYVCTSLQSVNLPLMSFIGSYTFTSCYNLLSLHLGASSVCELFDIGTFYSTPIDGYTVSTGGTYGSIYVPASLYSDYITATNWTAFSSRFVGV